MVIEMSKLRKVFGSLLFFSVLIYALTGCGNFSIDAILKGSDSLPETTNSSEMITIDITATVTEAEPSETETETEVTVIVTEPEPTPTPELISMDETLYGSTCCQVKVEPSADADVIGRITVNDEYHVIGQYGVYYVIEFEGQEGYVVSLALSDEPSEETEPTETDEETSETTASDNSSSGTSSGTTSNGNTNSGTSGNGNSNSGSSETEPDYVDTEQDRTPLDEPVATPTPEPQSLGSTPDLSMTYNGNTVSEYYVDGYGTVYGYFVGTSTFNDLVNSHRSDMGLIPFNLSNSEYTNSRAIECTVSFGHTHPNGQPGTQGEIIAGTSDNSYAFELFMASDAHRSDIETPYADEGSIMTTAAFVRVTWDEYDGWVKNSSALVANWPDY